MPETSEDRPRNLPAVPGEAEAVILEGRVIGEPSRPVPLRAVYAVRTVARHDRTRAAGRQVAYVGIGAAVITRRLWESRSTARYERHIRAAELAGDHESALAWDAQRVKFLKDRHTRRADLIELPLKVARELPKIAAGVLGLLIAIGLLLAIASRNVKEVAAPVKTVARIAEWVAIAFSVCTGRSCWRCRGSCSASCGGPGAATRTRRRPGGRWPASRTTTRGS